MEQKAKDILAALSITETQTKVDAIKLILESSDIPFKQAINTCNYLEIPLPVNRRIVRLLIIA